MGQATSTAASQATATGGSINEAPGGVSTLTIIILAAAALAALFIWKRK